MFEWISLFVRGFFRFLLNATLIGDDLMVSGRYRTRVVRGKSSRAGAVSEIRGETKFIKDFATSKAELDSVDDDLKAEAIAYLEDFEGRAPVDQL